MNNKKILIISDIENLPYWRAIANNIKEKIGPVRIYVDEKFFLQMFEETYDLILVDISNIENLYNMIPKIHHEKPKSRIIIVSSTPTWKQTREFIRLGAANLIRKRSNQDDFIDELCRI